MDGSYQGSIFLLNTWKGGLIGRLKMDFDFIDEIGEGAFYSDEENAQDREGDNLHPSDMFQMDIEDFIPFDEEV